MNLKNIYTVTVFRVARDAHGAPVGHRTLGWLSTFELAERCVKENRGDMYEEGYYDVALIEEVPEGILASSKRRWWYAASFVFEKYEVRPVAPPTWAKGIINWSMG